MVEQRLDQFTEADEHAPCAERGDDEEQDGVQHAFSVACGTLLRNRPGGSTVGGTISIRAPRAGGDAMVITDCS